MQLVNRYGDELEYDLHARLGLDLDDWFAGRYPWAKLLRLAGQLPRTSHYATALHDDDDAVAEYVAVHGLPEDDDAPAPLPPMTEWTPERAQLVALTEAVMSMQRVLVLAHGGKAGEVRPLPRPRTAWDRAARVQNISTAAGVIAAFSPAAAAAGPPELEG